MIALLAPMDKAVVRNWAWVLAAGVGALTSHGPDASALAAHQKARANTATKAAAPQFARYQVAAGTALLLEMSTPLNSGTSLVDDQVEAVLWSPVVQDGIELVPAGSTVFGKITDFTRATDQRPTGSVSFAFKIIEHAGTGSRETLSTHKIIMEAQRVADTGRGKPKKRFDPVDVAIPAGMRLVAMTSQPLIVRIPR